MREASSRPELVRMENFLKVGDFSNAHLALLDSAQSILTERYPFPVERSEFGLAMVFNGHLLAAIGAVVHDLVRSQTRLNDLQQAEIGLAIARLKEAECGTRILVVRNERIQRAVLQELQHRLRGVEVWNVDQLQTVDLVIR